MGTIGQEIIAGLTEAVGYMDGTANKAQFGIHDFAPVNAPEHVDVKANRLPLQAENTPPCLDMERRTPRRAVRACDRERIADSLHKKEGFP